MNTGSTIATTVALMVLPLAAQKAPSVSRAQMTELLASLDKAWSEGDRDDYLANVTPDHPIEQDAMMARHQRVWEYATLTRKSEIKGDLQIHGPRTVALVKHEVGRKDGKGPTMTLLSFVAAKVVDGKAVATLEVEVNGKHLGAIDTNGFRCPACNYRFGGGPDWLVVPLRGDRTGCMESAGFYLMGSDVKGTLSVHMVSLGEPIRQTFDTLTAALSDTYSFDKASVNAWIPPRYREKPPVGMVGLTATGTHDDQGVRVFLIGFGDVRFAITVEGLPGSLANGEKEIEELLQGFQLLNTKIAPEAMLAQAIKMHTGGEIVGRVYRNQRHGIEFEIPAEWKAIDRPGNHLFRLTLQCPMNLGAVWLTGHAPPTGRKRWDARTALAMCKTHLKRFDVHDLGRVRWRTEGDYRCFTWKFEWGQKDREFHVMMKDEILLLVDAKIADPRAGATISRCLASIR